MQAISSALQPWFQDIFHKPHGHDTLLPSQPYRAPAYSSPPMSEVSANSNKRKRAESAESHALDKESPKRLKIDCPPPLLPTSLEQPTNSLQPAVPSASNAEHVTQLPQLVASAATNAVPVDSSALASISESKPVQRTLRPMSKAQVKEKARDRIEAQFNLEILLKHNELRLIEQELAKCQISLEQLRRCQIIPYPGTEGISTEVTTGTGAALQPQPGLSRPQHPAPWGVTDGPYSRHYAQWLLPDAAFDPTDPNYLRYAAAGMDSRSMRSSLGERGSLTSSRSGRTNVASKLHSLSTNYTAPPKDRSAPLVVKHPTSGNLVKLVCKFCGKENISSTQGFLNHCRIAHNKNYDSHSAAALECGQPLSTSEAETYTTPTGSQPSQPTPAATSPVSVGTPVTPGPRPFVHGLITAPQNANAVQNPGLDARTLVPSPLRQSFSPSTPTSRPRQRKPTAKAAASSTQAFVGSADAPRLSSLLQKRGVGGDLRKLVTDVKTKIDIEQVPSIPAPEGEEANVNESQSAALSGTKPASQSAEGSNTSSAGTSSVVKLKLGHAEEQAARIGGLRTTFVPNLSSPLETPGASSPAAMTVTPVLVTPSEIPSQQSAPGSYFPPTHEHSDEDDNMDLSPHTVDTNPGLVTDDGMDEDFEDDDEAASQISSQDRRRSLLHVAVKDPEHDDEHMADANHHEHDDPTPCTTGAAVDAPEPGTLSRSFPSSESSTTSPRGKKRGRQIKADGVQKKQA